LAETAVTKRKDWKKHWPSPRRLGRVFRSVKNALWVREPIDAFIANDWIKKLQPSPEADKVTYSADWPD